MEKLKALVVLLILPVLGVLIPSFAAGQDIAVIFGSFAGTAGLVVILTQALKKELNYQVEFTWKYLPQLLSVIVSILFSLMGWYLGIGLFDQVENILHAVGLGFLISGVSNGWYDVPFVYRWANILFGIKKKV